MLWSYAIPLVILLGLFVFGQRRRRNVMAQEMVRISQIGFGDEVMTTSGLYGTVVGRNDDGTVQLAIAPGVEVKWALAALRDVDSLPPQYRDGIHDDDGADGPEGIDGLDGFDGPDRSS